MTCNIRQMRCALSIVVLLLFSPCAARADAVLHWNEIAVRTLTTQTPALNPFQQARFAAIIQLAVFEAVNAITQDYDAYLGSAVAPTAAPITALGPASAEAAAIAAAHAVLVNYFPGNATALNAERALSLGAIPEGTPKTNGIAAGLDAAREMIAERVGDGASPLTFYNPGAPRVGEWNITPGCPLDAALNPLGGTLLNWRDLKPFGVVRPVAGNWSEAFLPGPPPELTSNQYAKDYNEVKTVGVAGIIDERPYDREVVSRFYAASSQTFLFLTAARQLAEARGDSLSQNARNLALITIATTDSLVASFATKYHYLFWRPVTAIRAGEADGNRKTTGDGTFAPFIVTPCFPSYPSNHATGSNAAAEIMRRIYGAAGHSISLTNTVPTIGVVTLNYTSLKQICDDVDDARIFGGIHFRFDQEAGVRLGREVATYIWKNNLQRVHGSQSN
jgi:hypothetical protein